MTLVSREEVLSVIVWILAFYAHPRREWRPGQIVVDVVNVDVGFITAELVRSEDLLEFHGGGFLANCVARASRSLCALRNEESQLEWFR